MVDEIRPYSHGDAVYVSGIEGRTLTKWQQRGVMGPIGKINRSKRRYYSLRDINMLAVIRTIVETIQVQPAIAAGMADLIITEAIGARQLVSDGRRTDERRLALLSFVDDIWEYDVLSVKQFVDRLLNGEEIRPQALIPIDDIIIKTAQKIFELEEDDPQ